MLVQESLSRETPHFESMHDTADEAYETLSLSDLPLYGDQSSDESEQDLSAQSQGSASISSSDHDYFEFSSQELCLSTAAFPPENFIFCGKTIPYRNPDTAENISSKTVEISKNKQTNIKKNRGAWGVLGRRLGLSRSSKKEVQSKNGEKSATLMHKTGDHQWSPKKEYNSKQHVFPLHKMPILTSTSSGKARWYMFLFGVPKFSSEVKLNDMKSRQSRRHSLPPSPTGSLNYHDDEIMGGTDTRLGLWGLIRVLSCGGNHHCSTMIDQSRWQNRLE